jgi:hypothetical protein
LYEAAMGVYNLLIPLMQKRAQYGRLTICYQDLVNICKILNDPRMVRTVLLFSFFSLLFNILFFLRDLIVFSFEICIFSPKHEFGLYIIV